MSGFQPHSIEGGREGLTPPALIEPAAAKVLTECTSRAKIAPDFFYRESHRINLRGLHRA